MAEQDFHITVNEADRVHVYKSYFFIAASPYSEEPDGLFLAAGSHFDDLSYAQTLRLCTTGIRQLAAALESMFNQFDQMLTETDSDEEDKM